MGEGAGDTLARSEQEAIARLAAVDLPAHRVALRDNTDGMAWVVLEPRGGRDDAPRFTICRVAPCLLIMVEERGHRRFLSAGTIMEAMDAVRAAAGRTGAPRTLH